MRNVQPLALISHRARALSEQAELYMNNELFVNHNVGLYAYNGDVKSDLPSSATSVFQVRAQTNNRSLRLRIGDLNLQVVSELSWESSRGCIYAYCHETDCCD